MNAPYSEESEQAVIGAVLTNANVYHDVAAMLKADDFFLLRHRRIWTAIERIAGRGQEFDYLTVGNELRDMGTLDEIGGGMYLNQCVNNTPNSTRATLYAGIVAAASARRRLLEATDAIRALALDNDKGIDSVLQDAEKKLLDALGTMPERRTAHIQEPVRAVWDLVEEIMQGNKDLMGIPTGFRDLDKLLHGMKRGNLIYVAGRPGTGKSAFLLSIAMNVARFGKRVLFWTGEMSTEEVAGRALSSESGVSNVLRGDLTPDEMRVFVKAASRTGELPIWVDDSPGITLPQLRATAMRQSTRNGLDLLIVDYIGLMKAQGYEGNRTHEIGHLSRGLKALASELSIPVLCAAQLNRNLENRAEKRPQLSDLRDSGDLEQDGNVVIFLNPNYETSTTDVIVAKHRGGATGDVPLMFQKHVTRFVDTTAYPVDLSGGAA